MKSRCSSPQEARPQVSRSAWTHLGTRWHPQCPAGLARERSSISTCGIDERSDGGLFQVKRPTRLWGVCDIVGVAVGRSGAWHVPLRYRCWLSFHRPHAAQVPAPSSEALLGCLAATPGRAARRSAGGLGRVDTHHLGLSRSGFSWDWCRPMIALKLGATKMVSVSKAVPFFSYQLSSGICLLWVTLSAFR